MAGALKGITIEIGGNTTELSDELGRLGKSAKETGSDLAAVERALKFNPDNVELLAQRQKYASEQAQTLRQRLDAVNQALSSGGVEEGTRAYDQLRREVITTTDRIEKMEAKARESAEAMERIRSGANDAAQGLDALGDAADRAGSKIDATKEFLTGIMFSLGEDALDAGKSIVSSAVESAVAYDDAGARIEAAVGGATESARALSDVGRDLYSEGWGDSIDQMTDSVIQVREVMGDLSETDLSTVTRAAYTMEEAFGSDLSETLRGMDTLMVQFGLSANEAADMMVAGAQRGLDYTDELGDNVAEYGGRWAEAGLSASEYFSMLQAGVDAGAYSLDRVGDYLNEFLTSLSDGRMEEAIGGFSEGTQAVWESYQDGGATARDVLDAVIGEMRDCQSETEAMSKASELWGSLGEDNALDVVLALGDVTDSYGDVAGAAEEAGDAIEGGLGNKIESLGRKAQGVFETVAEPIVGMAEDALDAVDPLIEGFSNLDDGTQRLVVTLGALVAAGPKLAGAARTAKGAFDGLGQSIGGVTESRLTTPWMALIGILGGEVASAVGTYAEDCATAAENSERLADISGGVARQLAEIGEADVSPDGMDSLSESIDETAESIDGLISRSRQTSDEVISLFEEIASWESELGSNSSRLDAAVETIGELTTGQALSEDQQRDLALAVADYNEITGESVGVIDATTGALDTSTESIRQNAQAWKDNARLQGLIDYYGNLSAELAVTKSQTDSLREAYEQAQAAYDAARDEVTVIGGDGGEWQLYWDGWDGKGGEALMEAEDRLNAAKQAYDENQTAVEQLGQEIAATEAEIDSFNSAQVEAATSTGQAGDAASDAADSTGTLGESLKGLRGSSEGLWDVHDALDDLSEWAPDATEAIEGAMSSLDDGSVTLSQATDQINSALRDAGVEFDGFNEAQVEVMLRAGMTAEEIEREAESLAGAAQAAGEAGGELEGALAGMRGSADGLWDAGEAVRDLAGWAPDAAQAIERSFDALDRSGGDISAVTSEINAALQEAIPGFDGFNDAQVVTMFQAGMTGEEIEGLARSLAEAGDAAEESGGQIEAALQGYYGAEEGARDLASALDEAADYSQDAGAAIDVAFQDFNSTGGDIHDLASQINQILKEQGVITDDLSEAWVREAYAQGAAGDEVVRLAERQQELSDAEREQAEAAEEAARAREQAVESLREFAEATPGLQQAIEASGASLEEFALRLEETGYSIDQFRQDWSNLGSVQNPFQAYEYDWETFNADALLQGLQTNTQVVSDWAEGIQDLWANATTEQDRQFVQYLQDMGVDSATLMQNWIDGIGPSYEDCRDAYIANQETLEQTVVDNARAGMDAAREAGAEYPEALGEGAEANADAAKSGAEKAADSMLGPVDELNWQFEERGRLAGENLGYGVGSVDLSGDAQQLLQSLQQALLGVPDAMRAIGENAARSLGDGMGGADGGAQSLESALASGLADLPSAMATVGGNAAQSFGDGMRRGGERAAQELEGGLASGLADLPSAMATVGESSSSSFGGVMTSGGESAAQSLESGIASGLSDLPSAMVVVGNEAASSLGTGMGVGGGVAADAIERGLASGLSGLSSSMAAIGRDAGDNVAVGVAAGGSTAATGLVSGLASGLAGLSGSMAAIGTDAASSFGDGARGGGESAAQSMESGLASGLADLPSAMSAVGVAAAASMVTGMEVGGYESGKALESGLAAGLADLQDALAAVGGSASQSLSEMPGSMRAVGLESGQALADGIQYNMGAAYSAGQSLSDSVGSSLAAFPGNMRTVGESGGSSFAGGVQYHMGTAYSAGSSLSSAVGSSLSAFPSNMATMGRNGGLSFASGVGSASSSAFASGSSLAMSAASALSAADGWAWSSGYGAGSNFASGLSASGDLVRASAASLANTVASYLHHSTPDVGPLSDDDVWGLHMGLNISDGMDRSLPEIRRSALGMAEVMAGSVEEAAGVAARFSPDWALSGGWRNSAGAAEPSRSVVNVYIDGELLRASGMDEDVWRVLDRAASLKKL